LRVQTLLVVLDSESPSKELIDHIGSLESGKWHWSWRVEIVAKHGGSKLVRKVFEATRKEPVEDQVRTYPDAIKEYVHRPLVFTYITDSYLKFGYPVRLYGHLVRRREQLLGNRIYERVRKEDAPLLVKQIDRILAVKGKLMSLTDEKNRLDSNEIARMGVVREVLLKRSTTGTSEGK
jgi:hypothetical protein